MLLKNFIGETAIKALALLQDLRSLLHADAKMRHLDTTAIPPGVQCLYFTIEALEVQLKGLKVR